MKLSKRHKLELATVLLLATGLIYVVFWAKWERPTNSLYPQASLHLDTHWEDFSFQRLDELNESGSNVLVLIAPPYDMMRQHLTELVENELQVLHDKHFAFLVTVYDENGAPMPDSLQLISKYKLFPPTAILLIDSKGQHKIVELKREIKEEIVAAVGSLD